ncbi:MAG: low molecular weight phosphatase family protein, partial [Fimbriimonadaceae bacterium]|nr:low molecular weight phosphatase family protein [Alphaproteobacteria bacterium]
SACCTGADPDGMMPVPGDHGRDPGGGDNGELPGAVLFACSMNAVRSPMAAALMRHFFPRRVYVESAGVRSGELDGFAVAVMEELGIDISGHKPIAIDELHDTSFDVIITLSPEAHHQALELTRTMAVDVEYWPTMDPTATSGSRDQMLDAYRDVRDSLTTRIKKRFSWQPGPAV